MAIDPLACSMQDKALACCDDRHSLEGALMKIVILAAAAYAAIQIWGGYNAGAAAIEAVGSKIIARSIQLQRI